MLGQWALGEEALGEIDGGLPLSAPADTFVSFEVQSCTDVMIGQLTVAEVTITEELGAILIVASNNTTVDVSI